MAVIDKSDDITFKDDNAVSRLSVRDIIYANAYELEYPDGSSEYVVNRDELIKYLMELPTVYPKSEKSELEDIKAQIPNLVRYESADGQDLILAYDMARLIDEYISGKENTDGSN